MKKTILSLCSIVALLSLVGGCRSDHKNTGWQLAWEENFDQPALDASKWSRIPRGTSDWNNYMSPSDSCFAFRDGKLVLRGIINHSETDDTATYLTGGVWTKGLVGFQDGRLEICARLNSATGAWPAFWLMPQADEKWPDCGEIDIMERLNYDTIAYQTIHTYYSKVLGLDNEPPHYGTAPIKSDEFNVYTVEMHQDSLVFFINDTHNFTYPRIQTDKEGQFPFAGKDYYLMIDMQLGGSWVGAIDPADLPVEMEIDWVRFYKH